MYLHFYVYAYLRKDGTPYYIGKGKDDRAWKHQRKEKFRTPKDISRITIVENNLTELGAFALERRMIKWYGRKDLGTGILHNRTDGGDGISGFKHSDTTKKKIGESAAGRTYSDDVNKSKGLPGELHPNFGKNLSTTTKEKIADARRGFVASAATRAAIRNGKLGKPHPMGKSTCPHCGKTGGNNNMKRFHFDKCKEMSAHFG
jgi:hypothetical protein